MIKQLLECGAVIVLLLCSKEKLYSLATPTPPLLTHPPHTCGPTITAMHSPDVLSLWLLMWGILWPNSSIYRAERMCQHADKAPVDSYTWNSHKQ